MIFNGKGTMNQKEDNNYNTITENDLLLLNKISQEFSSSLEFDKVMAKVMSRTKEILNCEASSVILYNEPTDSLIFYAASGAGEKVVRELSIPKDMGFAGWVFEHLEPVISDNPAEDKRFYQGIDKVTGIKTRSLICVPVIRDNRKMGVIEGINKIKGVFSRRDLQLITSMAKLAGIVIDNSRVHKDLALKKRQLEELNMEMEEFVKIVSHDLQTPLASMKGYVDLIKMEMAELLQLNTELKLYIDRIGENCSSSLDFIRRLQSYIKLKDVKVSLHEFSPRGVLNEIELVFTEEIKHKGAVIKIGYLPEVLKSDRYMFYQILKNLVHNGLKRTKGKRRPVIEVGAEERESEYCFYVNDNGKGIPDKEQKEIFRLSKGEKVLFNQSSFGIGLAFVKKALDMIGGRIWIDSKPGSGITFYFTIPR